MTHRMCQSKPMHPRLMTPAVFARVHLWRSMSRPLPADMKTAGPAAHAA